VVEVLHQPAECRLEYAEIDHELTLGIESAFDRGGDPVVVAVQGLALVPLWADAKVR
jgi:hypothetical protein